jgi:hypothetical protein
MRENIGALVGCAVLGRLLADGDILGPPSSAVMPLWGSMPSCTGLSRLADDAAELCRVRMEEATSPVADNEMSWIELLDPSCRPSLLRFVPCREPAVPSNDQWLGLSHACWKRQTSGRPGMRTHRFLDQVSRGGLDNCTLHWLCGRGSRLGVGGHWGIGNSVIAKVTAGMTGWDAGERHNETDLRFITILPCA